MGFNFQMLSCILSERLRESQSGADVLTWEKREPRALAFFARQSAR
ncbi:unnamed protein product, partial [Arabidopsis halleri]